MNHRTPRGGDSCRGLILGHAMYNQAVRRNAARFPDDFMFQLSNEEFDNWRSQIVTANSSAKMGLRRRPYAFTEQGVFDAIRQLMAPPPATEKKTRIGFGGG